MAVPKRKISKQRRNKRSANWKMIAPNLAACPQCHELKENHKVCASCGFYDGRLVIAQEAKENN